MNSFKRYIVVFAVALVMVAPGAVAFAKGGGTDDPGVRLENPLKCADCDNLSGLLLAVAEEAGKIGFYIVVFFIIWSGFLFVSAQGNKTKLETAKKTFLYTIIGAAILLGAVVLANVIKGTVDQLSMRQTISQHLIV
jgi:hypothetical protein